MAHTSHDHTPRLLETQYCTLNIISLNNNNYHSLRWGWIVVDICWAMKQQGKCTPLSPTLRIIIIIVFVYTNKVEKKNIRDYFSCGNKLKNDQYYFKSFSVAPCSYVNILESPLSYPISPQQKHFKMWYILIQVIVSLPFTGFIQKH